MNRCVRKPKAHTHLLNAMRKKKKKRTKMPLCLVLQRDIEEICKADRSEREGESSKPKSLKAGRVLFLFGGNV